MKRGMEVSMINRIGIIYLKNCNWNERLDFVFLENIRKFYNRLIIICDSVLKYEERKLLEVFTTEIIVGNFDSDRKAWKFCSMEYMSKEERNNCDELTLISLNFWGFIKDYKKLLSVIDEIEVDVINICSYDLSKENLSDFSGCNFLILKRRVLEDYSFENFLKEKDSERKLKVFEDSGFRCHNYLGDEEVVIFLKSGIKALTIDIGNYELKQKIKMLIDSAKDSDGTKESLIRNIVANNSTESIRNLYDLDFVLKQDSEIVCVEGFTLCMFIETGEGVEKAKEIICNADRKWSIRVWLREEDFLEQIIQESDRINVGLFYRECMWEKVVETVEECQNLLIGFAFENGDIINFQDNFDNLFMNSNMISQLQQYFVQNRYMAAVLPKKYIGSDRFIRNELYRLRVQKNTEFKHIDWDIETPECAICCRTEILKECIQSTKIEEETLTWCETEAVKIIPHLLQINGYMVGHVICDKNILKYSQRLYEINGKQIRNYIESSQLNVIDFNDYLVEINKRLKEYYILCDKVKELAQENTDLLNKNKALKKRNGSMQVKEVPVLVDIGVKGAIRNWVKKHMCKRV